MNNPLVSIIMPIYNRNKVIVETLKSVFNQTYSNWECIIVDDISSDNTLSIIKGYAQKDSRVKVFSRPSDKAKGANACRNFGLVQAKGEYVIFFDSDDLLTSNCLESRVKYIHNSNYDMLVFSMGIFNTSEKLIIPESRIYFNDTLQKTLQAFLIGKSLPWNVSRPIFKLKLIKENVWFNEDLQLFQDDEFNIKVLKICKPNYLSIDEVDMYYRLSNKVWSDSFYIKFFKDLNTFYKSIFSLLDVEEKKQFGKGLFLKLFFYQKEYVRPFIAFKVIKNLIKLFRQELNLKTKRLIILYLGAMANKYYYKKKGYDRLYKELKRIAKNA